jgi:hypothetical protein
MVSRVREQLSAPAKGRPITAKFLGRIATRINALDHDLDRARVAAAQTMPANANTNPLALLDPATGASVDLRTAWTEIARAVRIVRVTNPDDDQQYVDVEIADAVTFCGPGGQTMTLVFNNS